ncbi:MAG: hypothetical protein WC343_14830 [Bacilli bacterium]|jgi:integrase
MSEIVFQGAQILTPAEYDRLRDQLNPTHRLIWDGMIFTGMRIEEFWRFVEHPEWFHPARSYVELPKGSILKVKAKQQERAVLLSNVGVRAIKDLTSAITRGEVERISTAGWRQNIVRAATKAELPLKGLTPKMARKTWVSWLMAVYPTDGLRIASSMGHDTGTLIRHYLTLAFAQHEREQIRMYVSGWGGNP